MKNIGYLLIVIGFVILGMIIKGFSQSTSGAAGVGQIVGMLIVPALPILIGIFLIKKGESK